MRNIYFFSFISLLLLVVATSAALNKWSLQASRIPSAPAGMHYIPGGSFVFGQSDQDITFSQIAQNRQVTVSPFFMDETEVSNEQYREFVNWVRDSIAVTSYLQDAKYFLPKTDSGSNEKLINWKNVKRIWGDKKNNNAGKLQQMYYQGDDRIFGRNEIDVRLLRYHFESFNYRAAANYKNDPTKSRADFIFRDTINIYPDTLVWLADFAYAQNEPMVEGYFSHPSFDEYPVVGITWRQARAFAEWRSRQKSRKGNKNDYYYQLPSEAQWEYAARGGKNGTMYPWGGPYTRNADGCFMANFKPSRGSYIANSTVDDKKGKGGKPYTLKVRSYYPNDFGLYNMAGNVAEWTSSAFNESATAFMHDLNPTYSYEAKPGDPPTLKRKVIRGGSWKDIGYFLQNSARTYEYQDTAKSYIGFRCVASVGGE
ncbi:gliding motility-associated lipoprotein GldK [bacterium A37T11]|nr:gliding motility-associated lipoprotein GldK [bacterium A37T11]